LIAFTGSIASLGFSEEMGATYAAYSDFQTTSNTAGAGVWGTDLPLVPEQCRQNGVVPKNWFVITDEGTSWSDGVAPLSPLGPGKPGSSETGAFHGTDDADFIVNLGGKRTLHAWGGNDCVVAGPDGDVVHGGDGSDVLIGGKKQHKGEFLFDASVLASSMAAPSLEAGDGLAATIVDEPAPLGAEALEPVTSLGVLDGEGGADLCAPGPDDAVANCETIEGDAREPEPPPSAPPTEGPTATPPPTDTANVGEFPAAVLGPEIAADASAPPPPEADAAVTP
jgi:hypothetical protein